MQAGKKEKKGDENKVKRSTGKIVVMRKADAPNIQQLHFSTFSLRLDKTSCFNTQTRRLYLPLPALITMDVVAAVSGYVSKMVTAGESASGSSSTKMKILLLDSETVGDALPKFIGDDS